MVWPKGDTPLRALAEGLAVAATAEAHRASLTAQTAERFERTPNDEPPILIVLASGPTAIVGVSVFGTTLILL